MNKEQFNKLPANKQRLLIAKDVLAQLKIGEMKPKRGVYSRTKKYQESVRVLEQQRYVDRTISPTEHVQKLNELLGSSAKKHFQENTCEVCAKGSLVIAWTKRFNEKTILDVMGMSVIDEIEDIFSFDLRNLMENLFEDNGWSIKKIMQNIVDNDGFLKYNGKLIS